QVREDEEDGHKDQHEDTKALALNFYRVTHVGHEVSQIPHGLIELGARHAALDCILRADITIVDVAAERLNRCIHANVRLNCTEALKIHHHMRHTNEIKDHVVNTQRTCVVFVEATQVRVNPGLSTNTGFQRQIWWRRAKPACSHVLAHGDIHQLANLGTGENQVFFVQCSRNLQIVRYPLVTSIFHGVAAHAVVGEQRCTTLQGFLVSVIRGHVIQRNRGTGCQPKSWQERYEKTKNQLSHYPVTLSGTGLVFSMRV